MELQDKWKGIREKIYPIEHIFAPVEHLIRNKPISGILLFLAVIMSMIWANSAYGDTYSVFWENHFKIGFDNYIIDKSLLHWINDGLMAIFFFVIGLEIKKEVMAGDLSTWRKASLPAAAAVGGMIIPALIFMIFNYGTPSASGWGVPMATDIAFILGILSLLGNKVPVSLKIFLTALAIVDDLGAVLVIAFFYTENLVVLSLQYGAGFLIVLTLANYLGIRNTTFYAIIGICGVWVAFLFSGIHATIAGVLLAMTIPSKTKLDRFGFMTRIKILLTRLGNTEEKEGSYLSAEQYKILEDMKKEQVKIEPPLQKLEHALNPFVSFIVLPLFALANAGITFQKEMFTDLTNQVSLGIILGLVLGKFLGILSFSAIMIKLKISELPQGVSWGILSGASLMAGIGFTMSIFISELAFNDLNVRIQAKMAILIASILAGVLGMLFIYYFSKPKVIKKRLSDLNINSQSND